jgi:subtilisin family serine protease
MAKYILLEDVTDRGAAGTQGIRLRPAGSASVREVALNEQDLDERDIAEARRDPRVLAMGADMPVQLIAPLEAHDDANPGGTPAPTRAATPTWGLEAVNAPAAHAAGFTGAGVCVAVIDTGIDPHHPAFAHLKPTLMDFTGDQAQAGSAPDENGHGTHCAGTIFGTHPSQTIAVAPGVTDILIGRVLDAGGHGGSAAVFKALQWAQQQGANVVSMSLGFDFPGMSAKLQKDGWPPELAASTALEAYRQNLRVFDKLMGLFKSLADMQSAPLVVAAAGNESRRDSDPRFRIAASLPSAAEDVVSVAALERAADGYAVAGFSNSMATVSGPGVSILSARMGTQGYKRLNGTSMACPHVAGVAALWWQAMVQAGLDPNPAQVARRLLTTCRLSGLGMGARDRVDIGDGLVQAPTAPLSA